MLGVVSDTGSGVVRLTKLITLSLQLLLCHLNRVIVRLTHMLKLNRSASPACFELLSLS